MNLLSYFSTIALCLSTFSLFAQTEEYETDGHNLHFVEFTDKNNTPYSIFRPQEFLSARAIDRRNIQGIEIDALDLPVTPAYVQQVLDMGVELHGTSKWLNAIAVHSKNKAILTKIQQLPFVKSMQPLGKFRAVSSHKLNKQRPKVDPSRHVSDYYGYAANQVKMLGGDILHSYGYTGEGVHVAIFDGGFKNVNRMLVFDSLRHDNRLLGTKDFVEGDDFVYENSSHGTHVLSCMASKSPHLIVGTAPDASYYLVTTEDVKGEFRTEEFNWVAALEYADSMGVDVINSSLGYTGFNDPKMSYKYEQLDGKTAMCTRGANIGASKGILVVTSAGNEGSGEWHYIGTPADAPGALSIAAVQPNGTRASFSSWGPTADGRIKPDVAAQGRNAVVASMTDYNVQPTNGTSFSSPIMAGMVASLKQAFPNETSEAIKDAIRGSGHLATAPDSSLGYGIPNFFMAYLSMIESSIIVDHTNTLYYSNKPFQKQLHLFVEQKVPADISITVYDKLHRQQFHESTSTPGSEIKEIKVPNIEQYPTGVYWAKITINGAPIWIKLIKE